MNSKKNAFTLIELLAIIVILAIIAVITVPIILNIIDNSRKGAATDSAYGYKDAVNKAYIQELAKPDNGNLKLNGNYTVQSNALVPSTDNTFGFGVTNYNSLPVDVSGDKPSSGTLTYSNNVLTSGCLVIGDYQVIFDGVSVSSTAKGDCSDYEFHIDSNNNNNNNGGNSQQQTGTTLAIGTTINYVTSLNGVELSDWKVFLSDEDYTYLIYDHYLPVSAISITNIEISSTYGITTYADDYSATLVNAMMANSGNWDSLLIGSINGHSVNQTRTTNVWAIGTPTLTLWTNSWNDVNNGFTTSFTLSGDDTNGYSINGNISAEDKNKGNYSLYIPYIGPTGDSTGYWLSTTSTSGSILGVCYNGDVIDYVCDDYYYALRPVIKLPTYVVNQ